MTCARSFLITVVTRRPSGPNLASHHTLWQHSTNSSTLTTNSVYNSKKKRRRRPSTYSSQALHIEYVPFHTGGIGLMLH